MKKTETKRQRDEETKWGARPQRTASLRLSVSPSPQPRGFTLTELLIVIGLIVLIIALAMPAFRYLSGGRSTEAATNVLGPVLTQARAEAIGIQKPRGALFYRDPVTDRIQAVLVQPVDPAPWQAGAAYSVGDYVVNGTAYYACVGAHTSSNNMTSDLANTSWWKSVSNGPFVSNPARPVWDIVPNRDGVLLPMGVDLRGVGANLTSTYGHPALVAFDGYGTLSVRLYYIMGDGIVGTRFVYSNANLNPDPAGIVFSTYSQIGLIVFDTELGRNNADANGATDAFIDETGTPLLINRYNGTIVKGE